MSADHSLLNKVTKMTDVAREKPQLEMLASRQFTSWLSEQNASLAFTTYQAGKLFFVGMNSKNRLVINERTFSRCMGLCIEGDTLYMSTLYQIWKFQNVLVNNQVRDGNDCLFVPQVSWITGDLDVHDIAVVNGSSIVFANTLFSCIATVSDQYSFEHVWHPQFIDKLLPEDRCHLNGLGARDGVPRYISAISQSNVSEGWRDRRDAGGVVVDVKTDEVVCEQLSMPHSPRWYRGRLWLLQSGTGQFGYINEKSGKFEPICFCPGYARGLSFINGYAVIGLSKSRNKSFSGLQLQAELDRNDAEARCGLIVVDLQTGGIAHSLTITGVVEELFDVAVLPGIRNPAAIGFVSDEIRRVLSLPPELFGV